MKKVFLIFIFLLLTATQFLAAQTLPDRDKLIKEFTTCFTAKSTVGIEPLLDEDFTMLGQKMPVALKFLQAMALQINDTIDSTQYVCTTRNGSETTITYDVYFTSKKRTVAFAISPEGKVKEIEIEGVGVQAKKTSEMGTSPSKDAPNIINIPFTLHKDLPIVTATIDGKERNFFFDSGAPAIILNSKYYSENSIGGIAEGLKGVAGQNIQSSIQKVSEFNLSGLKAENIEVMCMDLSQLEKKKSMPIHGLIGYSFIKDFDVVYDYAQQTITLIKKEHVAEYINLLKGNNMVKHSVEMEQAKHIPYVKATIGSKEYTMGIDCGASVNLLSGNAFDSLKENLKSIKSTKLKGGDTKGVKRQKGKVKHMAIGNASFSKTPTVFSDISHISSSINTNLDGLIGYPVLSKQKCMVSYSTGALLFLK